MLYTRKQADQSSSAGLGFVNDRSDLLHVTIKVEDVYSNKACAVEGKPSYKGKVNRTRAPSGSVATTVEVDLSQNIEALRHRRGDTGSVFWRVSSVFAQYILACNRFPTCAARAFLPATMTDLTVLELGSGTGGLGILLARLFKHWTFTDQFENLSLIGRNLKHNGLSHETFDPVGGVGGKKTHKSPTMTKLALPKSPPSKAKTKLSPTSHVLALKPSTSIRELDWQQVSNKFTSGRDRLAPNEKDNVDAPDLIVAVDCLYNPHLSPCLAHTIESVAGRDTVVIVVSELRDFEPLEQFLDTWLRIRRRDSGEGGEWNVVRVKYDDEWREGIGGRQFATWVGWRTVHGSG
ncbi:hypothetical protein ACM66B_000678 [Microbotryomycetes sp. NB124-2]